MYKKLQNWGMAYVISLVVTIILLDRLIVSDFLVSMNSENWHYIIFILLFISIVVTIVSWLFVNDEERRINVQKHSWKEKIKNMLNNTTKGSTLDIITLLIFLAFAAWIPDAMLDYVKMEHPNISMNYSWMPNMVVDCIAEIYCLLRPILYIGGLFILVYGKPSYVFAEKNITADERLLLLTGMSNVEIKEKNSNGEIIIVNNIEPLIEPLNKYPNIEKFLVLLSNEILKGYKNIDPQKGTTQSLKDALQTYKDKLLELNYDGEELKEEQIPNVKLLLGDLLRAYINDVYKEKKEVDIKFSAPVDYNNFDACNDECYRLLQEEMKLNNYQDKHIVVNTSPGTKMVTSAMAINSIKGNRALIYKSQKEGEGIIEANPNVSLIQFADLFAEREMGGTN